MERRRELLRWGPTFPVDFEVRWLGETPCNGKFSNVLQSVMGLLVQPAQKVPRSHAELRDERAGRKTPEKGASVSRRN